MRAAVNAVPTSRAFHMELPDEGISLEGVERELLLRALELMVGNRSSFLHTIIDGEGRFRVVPEPERWVAHARLCAAPYRL